eukprot:808377-Rhodomonas_salina.1
MKVRELPPGLLDTPASRSLFRSASHAIRIPYFSAYTPAEFRDCIYQVLMQHKTVSSPPSVSACARAAFREYGIGKSAFYKNLSRVNQELQGQELRDHLATLAFPCKGPPRFFLDDEIAIKLC